MNPTEELKEEHQAIKWMLSIMGVICEHIEAGEPANTEHLERIVEFIRGFADKCHHGKEEDLLFVAMEQAGVPKQGGPIGVMLAEHAQGRDYIKGLSQVVAAYRAGDQAAAAQIVENARGYIALLTQHIDKEDNVLYPMADRRLSAAKQAELLEGFEMVERERVGPGKHEEFHQLLHELDHIYLE